MLRIAKDSTLPGKSKSPSRLVSILFITIILSTYVVYVNSLSKLYIADGLRTYRLAVESGTPPIGPTNHLLAPTLAWLYYQLGKGIGYEGDDISLIQSLNAFFGASGVGLFFLFLMSVTGSALASVVGALLLAFSRSYSMHATDMTEVMSSFPLTMASVLFALRAARGGGLLWPGLAALAGALATGVYQSSLLDVPAIAVLMVFGSAEATEHGRRNYRPAILFVSGFGVLAAAIYLLTFRLTEAASLKEAFLMATWTQPRVYTAGSFDPIHLFGSAFGWANAVFGLRDWLGGTRLLERGINLTFIYNISILVFLIGITAFLSTAYIRMPAQARRGRQYCLPGLLLWFFLPALFTAYWGATHDKLWLHPVAAYFAVVSVLFGAILGGRTVPPSVKWRAGFWVGSLLALTVGNNVLFHLIPNRLHVNRELEEARRIAQIVRDEDLVIGQGNDLVALYFEHFSKKPYINYLSAASDERHKGRGRLAAFLAERIAEAYSRNGRIYFLGLVDTSREDWRRYLRSPIPIDYYDDLDIYRTRKIFVMPIRFDSHGVVRAVWQVALAPETS